jgi:hypothetical protein
MNISKDQIVQLLESQGNHDKAQQASQQLSDQVDTDTGGRWWRWPSGNLQPSGAVRADCPLAPHPLDPANPAAVLGSAGLDRRDIVVRPWPRRAGHCTARPWHSWSSTGLQLMMSR